MTTVNISIDLLRNGSRVGSLAFSFNDAQPENGIIPSNNRSVEYFLLESLQLRINANALGTVEGISQDFVNLNLDDNTASQGLGYYPSGTAGDSLGTLRLEQGLIALPPPEISLPPDFDGNDTPTGGDDNDTITIVTEEDPSGSNPDLGPIVTEEDPSSSNPDLGSIVVEEDTLSSNEDVTTFLVGTEDTSGSDSPSLPEFTLLDNWIFQLTSDTGLIIRNSSWGVGSLNSLLRGDANFFDALQLVSISQPIFSRIIQQPRQVRPVNRHVIFDPNFNADPAIAIACDPNDPMRFIAPVGCGCHLFSATSREICLIMCRS